MIYKDYLKTLTHCPFCDGGGTRILSENDGAYLTYALAPYHKYHLLVIPKRHIESILELTWDDHVCVMALVVAGFKVLNKLGHSDCTLLARDKQASGKSISHLHYHIIPGGVIQDISLDTEVRDLLTKDEQASLIKELSTLA